MTPTSQFDTRVTVQQKTAGTTNADGQHVPDWETFITRWAKVEQKGGGEEFRNGRQTKATVMYEVTLRSDSETRTITPKHRLSINGRTLDIKLAYDEGLQHREVKLECIEVL